MTRRGRRGSNKRETGGIHQLPWRQPVNPYPPLEVLSADQVEQIHLASLELLAGHGMRIMHAGARQALAGAGAIVDHASEIVRFDPDLVMEKVALAPGEITLHAHP